MIEMAIPKNIMEYEATLVGPLTTRQAICLGASAALLYAGYNVVHGLMPDIPWDSLVPAGVFLVAPIVAFLYKPYGMPMEVYLKTAFKHSILAPKKRQYVTKNIYEGDQAPMDVAELPDRKLRQHPEYVMYT